MDELQRQTPTVLPRRGGLSSAFSEIDLASSTEKPPRVPSVAHRVSQEADVGAHRERRSHPGPQDAPRMARSLGLDGSRRIHHEVGHGAGQARRLPDYPGEDVFLGDAPRHRRSLPSAVGARVAQRLQQEFVFR